MPAHIQVRSLQLADEAAAFANDAFSFWDKDRADVHLFAREYDGATPEPTSGARPSGQPRREPRHDEARHRSSSSSTILTAVSSMRTGSTVGRRPCTSSSRALAHRRRVRRLSAGRPNVV